MRRQETLKKIADLLTALRFVVAVVIPIIGLVQKPPQPAGLAGWLFLAALMTDSWDGYLARRSGLAGTGIFGRLDAWVDLVLALGGFTYLYVAGFVAFEVYGIVVVAVAVLCIYDFLVFQALSVSLLTIAFLLTAWAQSTVFATVCVLILIIYMIIFRKRFVVLCRRFCDHIAKEYTRRFG